MQQHDHPKFGEFEEGIAKEEEFTVWGGFQKNGTRRTLGGDNSKVFRDKWIGRGEAQSKSVISFFFIILGSPKKNGFLLRAW